MSDHIVVVALQIVEDMKAAGVEFNALTHSLLVESCVVQNDHQGAADAHYAAQAAGKPIRPESFEKLISRCERNGAYDLMVSPYPTLGMNSSSLHDSISICMSSK